MVKHIGGLRRLDFFVKLYIPLNSILTGVAALRPLSGPVDMLSISAQRSAHVRLTSVHVSVVNTN